MKLIIKITLTISLFLTLQRVFGQSAKEFYLEAESNFKLVDFENTILNAKKSKTQLGITNPKIESLLMMAYFNNGDMVNAKIAYETLMKITPSSKKQSDSFQSYVDICKQIDNALAKEQNTFLEEVKSKKRAGEKKADEIEQAYEKEYLSKNNKQRERYPEKRLYRISIEQDRFGEYLQFKNSFNLKTSEKEKTERKEQKNEYYKQKRKIEAAVAEWNFAGYHDGLLVVKMDDKWGYVNRSNELQISPIYSYARDFHNGFAIVSKDGKSGLINTLGEVIIPIIYDRCGNYANNEVTVSLDNISYILDEKGGILRRQDLDQVEYDYIHTKWSGDVTYVRKQIGTPEQIKRAMSKTKYALINRDGKILTDFIYDYVYSTGIYKNDSTDTYWIVEIGKNEAEKKGLVSNDGFPITAIKYKQISGGFYEGLIWAKLKNKKEGYINNNGEVVIPFIYDNVDWDKDIPQVIIVEKEGKWGAINTSGEVIVPILYESARVDTYFPSGYGNPYKHRLEFRKGGEYFHFDHTGKRI